MKKLSYEQPVVEIVAFSAQDAVANVSNNVPDMGIEEL